MRQQTGAALLPDCRAYELVSSANTGGYDVESSLAASEEPYGGYPQASGATGTSRVLYGVHDGGIPGLAGDPTNKGVNPYVATRGPEGWSTEYVGVPADDPFASEPFSSAPTGADASLDTFAFGAPGGCSPCFADGYTGIPVRLPGSQEIVQGMVAAKGFPTPPPTAKPDGYIAQDLSANGEHLIFGSTTPFAEGGNNNTGDVSIYDRNLKTEETHLISNSPAGKGHPLACLKGAGECHSPGDANGISELDISADGSHVLLGQKVSTDADGNNYWHLYMNIGDSEKTIALTPGATGSTGGVLFDGMTSDGSKVFFSSEEHLTGEDTSHTGADIFMWSQKGEEEGKPLSLISTGTEAERRILRPRRQLRPRSLEHDGLRSQLRRRRDRRRWRRGLRQRYDLLPLPEPARRHRRTCRRGKERPQPLRRPPRLGARIRRYARIVSQRTQSALDPSPAGARLRRSTDSHLHRSR